METSIRHFTDRAVQLIASQICVLMLILVGACVQVPGKEFTRTCKGLVVVLLSGYALLYFLPSSIDYLAIVPAKYVFESLDLFLCRAVGSSSGVHL